MPLRTAVLLAGLVLGILAPRPVLAQSEPLPDAPVTYRIQPSDVLTVKYRYTPEYDYTIAVPPDGVISLPIVGLVKVAGLTTNDAIEAIRTQASQRLRDPEVTVELKDFQRPRFFVGGEVGKPGEFPMRGRLGLLEAIAMAGGFKSSAKHSQVVLIRRVDEGHALRTVLNAKELAKNIETRDVTLQAGDVLFVPQNRISKVTTIMPIVGALGGLGIFYNNVVQ